MRKHDDELAVNVDSRVVVVVVFRGCDAVTGENDTALRLAFEEKLSGTNSVVGLTARVFSRVTISSRLALPSFAVVVTSKACR